MSAIFEEMDRLAAEKFAETPETTLGVHSGSQRTEGAGQQSVEEPPDVIVDLEHRETSDSRAPRDTNNYRVIPTSMVLATLRPHPKEYKFAIRLLQHVVGERYNILKDLKKLLDIKYPDLVELYAHALYERAIKYDKSICECGLYESDLLLRALYHLCKLVDGDSTEDHRVHLVWCVMTLVFQNATEFYRELEDE